MPNFKLVIEYDGTNYCGWQTQKNHKSKAIQETIEHILQQILQEKIHLIVSGRTDAGVHAQAQVANFQTNSKITLDKLQKGLNSLLPDDIKITRVGHVASAFHSRFSARSKTYRYLILNRTYPSALLKNRVYFFPQHLDVRTMQQEARCLVGRHDFKAFSRTGSRVKDTVRTIKKITIKKTPRDPLIIIEITANGFLYNMVRNIVGTLVEAGKGKLRRGELRKILLSRDRKLAGSNAPSQGLYLLKVNYD